AGASHLSRVLAAPPPLIGRVEPDEGNDHAADGSPLQFASDPPSSGNHYPVWLTTGVYDTPQPTGNWVHSLEHGYIVLLYACPNGCPDLVAQLQQFYEAAPKSARYRYQKLIVTP